jgi:hypothetical protein
MYEIGSAMRVIDVHRDRAIVGYRVWRTCESGKEWASVYRQGFAWKRGKTMQAEDDLSAPGACCHTKPKRASRTGFWCFKDRDQCHDYVTHLRDRKVGKVYIWGRVVEHRYGYRAEFARMA